MHLISFGKVFNNNNNILYTMEYSSKSNKIITDIMCLLFILPIFTLFLMYFAIFVLFVGRRTGGSVQPISKCLHASIYFLVGVWVGYLKLCKYRITVHVYVYSLHIYTGKGGRKGDLNQREG